jgi:hypothetical protein
MLLKDLDLLVLCACARGPVLVTALAGALQADDEAQALAPGEATAQAVLQALSHSGLVTQRAEGWALTPAGRGVVQTALIERLKQPASAGETLALALDHLHVLRPAQIARALRLRLAALEGAIAHMAAQAGPAAGHRLAIARADRDWARAFLAEWEQRYPAARAAAGPDADPAATPLHQQTGALSPAKKLQRIARSRPAD